MGKLKKLMYMRAGKAIAKDVLGGNKGGGHGHGGGHGCCQCCHGHGHGHGPPAHAHGGYGHHGGHGHGHGHGHGGGRKGSVKQAAHATKMALKGKGSKKHAAKSVVKAVQRAL